ncbi:MAG: peptidase, partial [Myxococcaceae bacterium]|nr:peptidase [Myxococcaceae bacterium]
MFRFRIGSIPVDVHISHLAISGLIAWSTVEGFRPTGWPGPVLDQPTHPDWTLIYGLCIGLWMSIVSVSILVQLTLGLVAGAIGLGLQRAGVAPGPVTYALFGLFAANLVWAVLNLLPVSSLDGGRISSALLIRLFGRRGFLFAQLISVALGVLVIALAWENVLLALIFGMNVVRAMAHISAYFKGELPPAGPTHPYEIAFLHAEGTYKAGKLEEAGALLKALGDQELQPPLRARVHDLA